MRNNKKDFYTPMDILIEGLGVYQYELKFDITLNRIVLNDRPRRTITDDTKRKLSRRIRTLKK